MSHDVHTGHPDTIYFDNCEECTSKAQDPVFHMDQHRARKLWRKMIDVEIFENGQYNSTNEQIAASRLYRIYIFLERNTTINPQTMEFLT
jgi:hypothetical protein